ncbi:anti-sigma factor [Actinokineospora sp. HUAS TT18]|uniref:anti-sigma factor n=1 Tax=Actinokineospora sp. HUAS TT18 TaxID=3447451 RepID=UPI003F51B187
MRDETTEFGEDADALPASIATLLREEYVWTALPPDLWQRTWAQLDTASETTPPVEDVIELAPARERRRLTTPVLAAASIVPVALVGILAFVAGASSTETSPDHLFALRGTELQPDARGEAALRHTASGLEISIDITGLPPAPANSYYQGWLKGDTGAVTIGTFHARDGADDIVLWSGVIDTAKYRTLTVTIQGEGAGPASSGRVLLAGHIAER